MTNPRFRHACLALVLPALASCAPPARGPSGGGGSGAQGGGNGGVGGGGAGGGAPADRGKPFSGDHFDPSAGPAAKDAFGGPPSGDPASRPDVVYPLRGAMLGRNIGGMNIQWRAGAGNKIFRARVKGDAGQAFLYAGEGACPSGKCRLPVPDGFWKAITGANAGAAVSLSVDAVAAPGTPVASGDAVEIFFSPEDLQGGLYYWSTSLPGIMRVRLGDATPEPFIAPKSAANPSVCSGCHSVSRDGCRVAYAAGEGIQVGSGFHLGIVDAREGKPILVPAAGKTSKSHFQTWSPDNSRLLTLAWGEMTLRDRDGAELAKVDRSLVGPPGHDLASHPEWSPDGESIALTRQAPAAGFSIDIVNSGDIMVLPYAGGALGPAKALVEHTADEFHYYPHFSPDSRFIVFNTGRRPGHSILESDYGFSAYDQESSRLRLVPAAGGAPIELGAATGGPTKTASWPKFSPFAQRKGSLYFIVFSSKLDYGFLIDQATVKSPFSGAGARGLPQLWVAAIDPSRAGDPSYAPFWLPFQRPEEGNHIAYWTTRIVGGTVGGVDCGK